MKDRFAILDLDIKNDVGAQGFRDKVSLNLDYGAVYTPYLNTALTYAYDGAVLDVNDVTVYDKGSYKVGSSGKYAASDAGGINVIYNGTADENPTIKISKPSGEKKLTFQPLSWQSTTLRSVFLSKTLPNSRLDYERVYAPSVLVL